MPKGQIAIDGDTFHFAGNARRLLDVTHDAVEPVRKKRVVLDVGSGHETWQQVGMTLVEDLVVDDAKCVSHAVFCHGSPFEFRSRL